MVQVQGMGHKKTECPKLKKGGGTTSVVIAKKQDDSDSDSDIRTISSEKSCEAWLLDSASSFHATPKKEWSRHTLRRMVVLLTWEMIRIIIS